MALNIGGDHLGIDARRNSEKLFTDSQIVQSVMRRKDIALEEFKQEMIRRIPGRDAVSMAIKSDILKGLFHTRVWAAVADQSLARIEMAIIVLPKIVAEVEKLHGDDDKTSPEGVVDLAMNAISAEVSAIDDIGVDLPDSLKEKYGNVF